MPRPLRIEYPGAIYHVTSRGNAQASIFLDDIDRNAFLSVLGLTMRRFNVICHAYCLMTNHFHLLLETPDANLSKAMRQFNSVYTQAFNRRHGRVGHVLQGRFKSIVVDRDAYHPHEWPTHDSGPWLVANLCLVEDFHLLLSAGFDRRFRSAPPNTRWIGFKLVTTPGIPYRLQP